MFTEWLDFRTFLLFLLVFSPLEHLLPIHEKARLLRRGWLTDVLHFFLSGILIRLGLFGVIVLSVQLGSFSVPSALRENLVSLPLLVQLAMVIIVADLGFYLAHRLMHTVPFLWKFHAVHHSSEELDWLAAFRVHPVDQVIVKGASLIPIFALGFSEAAILISAVIYSWHSIILHSNINVPFGPFKWLVASPEFHHWHHANHREAYDKNFAGQLSIWDLVFGTAHLPDRMPERYGVSETVPETYLGQLAYPFERADDRVRRKPEAQTGALPTPALASDDPAGPIETRDRFSLTDKLNGSCPNRGK